MTTKGTEKNQKIQFSQWFSVLQWFRKPVAKVATRRMDRMGAEGMRFIDAYILPDTAPDAPGQLYNLETDPGETINLYV